MHTSSYDTMIADYLKKERGDHSLPETLTIDLKVEDMRYGETRIRRLLSIAKSARRRVLWLMQSS